MGFNSAFKGLSCPYTYESGSRLRLGDLDSGASLRYISPHTHEWVPARDTLHTDEFDSLEPKPSGTREPDSYVYGHLFSTLTVRCVGWLVTGIQFISFSESSSLQ